MSTNRLVGARVAAVALCGAALVGTLAACNNDGGKSIAASGTSAAASASTAASSVANNAKGGSAVKVDDQNVTGNFETTCAKTGDTLALALTDSDNEKYGKFLASATVSGGNKVTAVAVGGTSGGANGLPYAIGYSQGGPGGSAEVSNDGNTYHVTGSAVAPDLTNPTAAQKTSKFDITFACTSITNG